MPHYLNLALVSEEEDFASSCLDFANRHFAGIADVYLLGENCLPHVTLCQFRGDSERLGSLRSECENSFPHSLELKPTHFYIRPGRGRHTGHLWLGLAIEPSAELLDCQRRAVALLSGLAFETQTPASEYFPHLSMARCGSEAEVGALRLAWDSKLFQKSSFKVALALSNPDGVMLKTLGCTSDWKHLR